MTQFAASGGAGRKRPGPKLGRDDIHVAVDDYCRFVYAEALPDEKAATTAGFLERMASALAQCGITVERVPTDNAKCYSLGLFVAAARHRGIRLKTRPFRRRPTATSALSSRPSSESGLPPRVLLQPRTPRRLQLLPCRLQLQPASHCPRRPAAGLPPVNNGLGTTSSGRGTANSAVTSKPVDKLPPRHDLAPVRRHPSSVRAVTRPSFRKRLSSRSELSGFSERALE